MSELVVKKGNVLSVKFRVLATLAAVVAAVALPQLLHYIGLATGTGNALGQMLLPMHLPVILVGLIAGPAAGAVAGAVSPVISFAMSGMPAATLLPFMVVELFGYGLAAGLLKNTKMPFIGKTLVVQVAGRLLRALATVIAFYVFQSTAVTMVSVWTAVTAGVCGIALQLILVPVIMTVVNRFLKNEE